MKKVYLKVPRVGDRLLLDDDWTFGLYNEYRNDALFDVHSLSCEGLPRDAPQRVTLPAGTLLEVSRVYIRQGNKATDSNDYDSLTFRLLWHPTIPYTELQKHAVSQPGATPAVRFWAKIDDCNGMSVIWDPPTPQELKDIETKARSKKQKSGKHKITSHDYRIGDACFKKSGDHTWVDKATEQAYGWYSYRALELCYLADALALQETFDYIGRSKISERLFEKLKPELIELGGKPTSHTPHGDVEYKMGRPPLVRSYDDVTGVATWYTAYRYNTHVRVPSFITGLSEHEQHMWQKLKFLPTQSKQIETAYQHWLTANEYDEHHHGQGYLDEWIKRHNNVIDTWLSLGRKYLKEVTRELSVTELD